MIPINEGAKCVPCASFPWQARHPLARKRTRPAEFAGLAAAGCCFADAGSAAVADSVFGFAAGVAAVAGPFCADVVVVAS